jgi:hypothetical protein
LFNKKERYVGKLIMNPERIAQSMDEARMRQDEIDAAQRAAGIPVNRNATTRYEFLNSTEVNQVFAEVALAPTAGQIFSEAAAKPTDMARLETVIGFTPAERADAQNDITTIIGGLPAGASQGDIMHALNPDQRWLYSNFMRAEAGRPATALDRRLQAVRDSDAIPAMTNEAWDTLTSGIDYAEQFSGILQNVNNNVNRKLILVTNNTDLLARDPDTLNAAERTRLDNFVHNANISTRDYEAMRRAAQAEISHQGPTGTEARYQQQISTLEGNLQAATNRGDTLLMNTLQTQLDDLNRRHAQSRDRAMNKLRNDLTASEIRKLSHDDARERVDIDSLNTPATTGNGTNLHAAEEEAAYREKRLRENATLDASRDRYVEVSADKRNSHLGELARNAGVLTRAWRFLSAGISTRRSEQVDANVARERAAHDNELLRVIQGIQLDLQNEGRSEQEIREATHDLVMADYTVTQQRILEQQQDTGNNSWVARTWSERGRFARATIVAAPALVAGAAAGAVTAAFAAPLVLTVGAGLTVGYLGRKYGHRVAGNVNRNSASTPLGATDRTATWILPGVVDQNTTAGRAHEQFSNYAYNEIVNRGGYTSSTAGTEGLTRQETLQNQGRRRTAGAVGQLAASAGFAVGEVGDALYNAATSGHQAATNTLPNNPNTAPSSPTTAPVTPAHPVTVAPHPTGPEIPAGFNANTLPYDAAAHLTSPDHAMQVVRGTADYWNSLHPGAGYHIVNVNGVQQVYDGTGHALNAAREAAFNNTMPSAVKIMEGLGLLK